jgi:hypothetical protein
VLLARALQRFSPHKRMEPARTCTSCSPARSVESHLEFVLPPVLHFSTLRSPSGQKRNRQCVWKNSQTDRDPVRSGERVRPEVRCGCLVQAYGDLRQMGSTAVWPLGAGRTPICSFLNCPSARPVLAIGNRAEARSWTQGPSTRKLSHWLFCAATRPDPLDVGLRALDRRDCRSSSSFVRRRNGGQNDPAAIKPGNCTANRLASYLAPATPRGLRHFGT